jgi:histidinol-phosphate aminotransferase
MAEVVFSENGTVEAAPKLKAKQSLSVQIFDASPRQSGILLDTNEFRFPLPRALLERISQEIVSIDIRHYPDAAELDKLKVSLSRYINVDPDNILLGVGSTELLDSVCRTFGEGDHKVVTPVPGFPMYLQYANLNGRMFVPVPLDDNFVLSKDVSDAMLAVAGSKVFYVCSPNNPTGRSIGRSAFEALSSDSGTILCLDEAYADYSNESFVSEAVKRDNVIVTRTLSKIGIAGCRVGYLVASKDLVRELSKGSLPYTLNSITLRIAKMFIEEMALIRNVIDDIKQERERLSTQLAALPGFRPCPSEGNFILCSAPSDASALAGRLIDTHRIWVRAFPPHSRLRNHLRIAVGLPEENDKLVDALRLELPGAGPTAF